MRANGQSQDGPATQLGCHDKREPAQLDCVGDLLIQHYFKHPSYWRIDGKPYFSFYDLTNLLASLGGVKETRAALDRLRAKAEKKIAKIKNELRAEEAKVDAWLERRRAKTRAKLDALGHSLDGATAGKPRRVARRARPKR